VRVIEHFVRRTDISKAKVPQRIQQVFFAIQ
jgi:hypothetical protein